MRSPELPHAFDLDDDPENVWPNSAVEAAEQMRDVLALFIRISEEFGMTTTAQMLHHTVDTARQEARAKCGDTTAPVRRLS
jgi:DNA primase